MSALAMRVDSDPDPVPVRAVGKVIFYTSVRGYGRIRPDDDEIADGLSLFFGSHDLGGEWIPRVGDRVSFVVERTEEKVGAVDVRPIR